MRGGGPVRRPSFGVYVPHGWKGELGGGGSTVADSRAHWNTCLAFAREAERLGYDSVWVYDHVHTVPEPSGASLFEAWVTLTALAGATTRVRLGPMVGCASYRNPALTAKMAATLDVVSGGRVEFGIGAGWAEREYRAYGYEFPPPRERLVRLREAVTIARRLWAEETVTFIGEFHTVRDAWCAPKPLQQPGPPVWVGGNGPSLLRVAAHVGDRANFGGPLRVWRERRDTLRRHLATMGRPEDAVTPTLMTQLFVRGTDAEVREAFEQGRVKSLRDEPFETWRDNNLVGTPEAVAATIEQYATLGCADVVMWCADAPGFDSLECFAKEVAGRW
jgi:F420-dependent oxidoreductase-like protein